MKDLYYGSFFEKKEIDDESVILSSDTECDITVIGGGLDGLITAFYLVANGLSVSILEKDSFGERAHLEKNYFNCDLDLTDLSDRYGTRTGRRIFFLAKKATEDLVALSGEIGADISLRDSFVYTDCKAFTDSFIEEYKARNGMGLQVEYYGKSDRINDFPFFFQSGILTKRSAGCFSPVLLTERLISYLHGHGAKLFKNCEAATVSCTGNGFTVTAGEHTVSSRAVVDARGHYAAKDMKKKLFSTVVEYGARSEALRHISGDKNSCFLRNDSFSSFIGNDFRVYSVGYPSRFSPIFPRESSYINIIENKCTRLKRETEPLYYGVNGIYFTDIVSRPSYQTRDGLPRIGEMNGVENYYYNYSFGRLGILSSAIGAKIISAAFLGNKKGDLEIFSAENI